MSRRGESRYQLVSRELRARILQGVYSDGQRLPTETELSATYGVSRQTIRRAFQDLVAEEMVFRVPGRGTFAKASSDTYIRQVGSIEDLMGLSDDTAMCITDPLTRRVDLISASRLRLPIDTVFNLRFTRMHDGAQFCTTEVNLPPDIGRRLASIEKLMVKGSTSTLTIIGLIESELNRRIAEAQQSITVEPANEFHARYLNCELNHPLLRIDRLYLDREGNGLELAISHFLPEHYSYRISLRRGT